MTASFERHKVRRALLRAIMAGAQITVALPVTRAYAQASAASAAGAPAGTRLILLGTQGGPNVNLQRGEAASAVLVDGEPYLVDCGYGTLRALAAAGLRYLRVANVFITHLHDDHMADVAALLSHQWTSGRTEPTTVHGPHGTRAMVEAALAYTRANVDIRTVDEGRTVEPADMFRGHDVGATGTPTEAFKDARVTVTAVENTHFPGAAKSRMPYRALAYRFDTADRSIVFSGDTTYSEALVRLATGADILVCEAMDVAVQRRAFESAVAQGNYADNAPSIWRHIAETHSTTEQAGRMAAEAKVKTLVLNHLLPGSNPAADTQVTDETYIEGVRKAFDGEVIVGKDGMVI
jgi:ribonuclease BN (tRNA processing enzyme)